MTNTLITTALLAVLTLSGTAQAENAPAPPDTSEIAAQLQGMYPKTRFSGVRRSPVAGLYEVTMGDNVAYTDVQGRYFIFGHLYDMKEQLDLTAQTSVAAKRVAFPSSFLNNAIKVVKGDGSRVVAVFSDPDCPYCRRLEGELAKLDNITVYTFLFPLESQHPESKSKSIAVWCAADRQSAWRQAIQTDTIPRLAACANPINDNLVLGSALGVFGTPTLIAMDGRVLPGAASADRIDQWLNAGRSTAVLP